MDRVPDLFRPKLEQKRSRVVEMRQALAIAEAELAVWEDAIRLVTAARPAATIPVQPHGGAMLADIMAHAVTHSSRLSDQWRNIFAGTASIFPRAATLDEMAEIADRLGTPVDRNTLRSQASNYAGKGVLERVGQGSYRLTQAGAEQLGVALPKEAALPQGPREIEAASPVQEDAAQS